METNWFNFQDRLRLCQMNRIYSFTRLGHTFSLDRIYLIRLSMPEIAKNRWKLSPMTGETLTVFDQCITSGRRGKLETKRNIITTKTLRLILIRVVCQNSLWLVQNLRLARKIRTYKKTTEDLRPIHIKE